MVERMRQSVVVLKRPLRGLALGVVAIAIVVGVAVAFRPSGKATVTGTLRMVGGSFPGRDIPVGGSIEVTRSDGSVAARADVESDGRFKFYVASGTYGVVGRSPRFNDGTLPCGLSTASLTVSTDNPVTISVECPMR
jgi:hypothetical protein